MFKCSRWSYSFLQDTVGQALTYEQDRLVAVVGTHLQASEPGLVAWATNMGLGRMGEISDIGYPTLATTSANFIRLETLRAANDRVSNATAELSIFRHYDIGDSVHSSSDMGRGSSVRDEGAADGIIAAKPTG